MKEKNKMVRKAKNTLWIYFAIERTEIAISNLEKDSMKGAYIGCPVCTYIQKKVLPSLNYNMMRPLTKDGCITKSRIECPAKDFCQKFVKIINEDEHSYIPKRRTIRRLKYHLKQLKDLRRKYNV